MTGLSTARTEERHMKVSFSLLPQLPMSATQAIQWELHKIVLSGQCVVPISGTGTESFPCCVWNYCQCIQNLKRRKKWVYFPAEKYPSALFLAHTTNGCLLKGAVVCGRDFLNTATKQLGKLRAKCVSAVVDFLSRHSHTLPLAVM